MRTVITLGSVVVPETVKAGEPFTITIKRPGQLGCIRDGGTDVTVEQRFARVIAYDTIATRCPLMTPVNLALPRDIAVLFPSPGDATVRIVGYVDHRLVSQDYPIVVVP